MKIKDVLNSLFEFSPLYLQEDFDNSGLQTGVVDNDFIGVLLCLDVTEAIVDEAINKGCNLIVSHHPLIFHKLNQITNNNYVERTLIKAIKNDVVIAAMHTNLDNAKGGVNFKIAEKIGLKNVSFINEEQKNGMPKGSAVIGELPQEMESSIFSQHLKQIFNIDCLQINEPLSRNIKTVAICGGSGEFMLEPAIANNADAFITGEMHYHTYFGYNQQIQICVMGHYQSEKFTVEVLESIIKNKFNNIKCVIAETQENPIKYV